jgi:hypothetical protein
VLQNLPENSMFAVCLVGAMQCALLGLPAGFVVCLVCFDRPAAGPV